MAVVQAVLEVDVQIDWVEIFATALLTGLVTISGVYVAARLALRQDRARREREHRDEAVAVTAEVLRTTAKRFRKAVISHDSRTGTTALLAIASRTAASGALADLETITGVQRFRLRDAREPVERAERRLGAIDFDMEWGMIPGWADDPETNRLLVRRLIDHEVFYTHLSSWLLRSNDGADVAPPEVPEFELLSMRNPLVPGSPAADQIDA